MTGHLFDKTFRRLTFDMMLAWEVPAADSPPLTNVCFSEYNILRLILSGNLCNALFAVNTGGPYTIKCGIWIKEMNN